MTEHASKEGRTRTKGVSGFLTRVWVSIEYISVQIADMLTENVRIMRAEIDLFLGSALVLLGGLNWSSAKYCDGNTSDYLSCTRPATYYYYGGFEIALVVFGTLLVLIWFVKNRRKK